MNNILMLARSENNNFESSRPSRQSLYFNRGYGMLPLTWPGKWKEHLRP